MRCELFLFAQYSEEIVGAKKVEKREMRCELLLFAQYSGKIVGTEKLEQRDMSVS